MLIQCPSCRARVTLSDGHAGAKVRCSECGRVYVARPEGSARASRSARGRRLILALGVLAVLAFLVFFMSTKDTPVAAQTPPVAHENEPRTSEEQPRIDPRESGQKDGAPLERNQ